LENRCLLCGACCIAFDIKEINKKAGEPCVHLTAERKCGIYEKRPWGCKGYKPDELCVLFSSLSEEDRVRLLRRIYGC
jgi:Fe-S-cluster containining protein